VVNFNFTTRSPTYLFFGEGIVIYQGEITVRKKIIQISGGFILFFAILLSFALSSAIIWGDLEASLFTSGINPDSRLKNLNCPVLITSSEVGTVYTVIKNPTNKDSERYLMAFVSEGYASLVREIRTKVPIPASGKQKVEWKIYPEDAAFERVVLFRVYMNAKYPYPSMGGNCGVIRIDFPWLTGNQIFAALVGITLVSMASGTALWEYGIRPANNKTRNRTNAVYFLLGTLIVAGILGYVGMWVFGIMALAVAVILLGVIVFRRTD